MKKLWTKYLIYLLRWQLSTPILSIVLIALDKIPTIWATVIANLIGGLIFFWVDRLIFNKPKTKKGKERNMYIFKIYNSRLDIIRDYNEEVLQDGYIIAYDRRLYEIAPSPINFMQMITEFNYTNQWEYEHTTKMCNLEYYDSDIINIKEKTASK